MEKSLLFKQLTQESNTITNIEYADLNNIEPHNSIENIIGDDTLPDKNVSLIENVTPQNEINESNLDSNVVQFIKLQEKLENDLSDLTVPCTLKLNLEQKSECTITENESSYRKRKTSINPETEDPLIKRSRCESNDSEIESHDEKSVDSDHSGSEYVPSENDLDSDEEYVPRKSPTPKTSSKTKVSPKIEKVRDDGDFANYKKRSKKISNSDNKDSDKKLDYHVKVPACIWSKLYQYQKIGVKWMNELNHQKVGGLLGDEMGLGKTVQIIAFLAALDYSKTVYTGNKKGLGPTLIICPATVMQQWVKHFHEWWPPSRVAILHQSGSFKGRPHDLIREMNKESGILITTYQGMLKYNQLFCELYWHYIVLDEGHKIRNPSAKVTEAVKHIQTPHRLILTGSPMQNNLTELWSLFDFIVPGKLGTLQVFMDHFATPILQGGYANASPFQEATALSIATALKNVITPYMLRRAKVDVQIDLPSKNEQVLFCELTKEQTDLYKHYLMTEHVGTLLNKDHRLSNNLFRAKMLMAVTVLRKICNHPDLYLGDVEDTAPNISKLPVEVPIEERYGYYKRAGKMRVVAALLKIWKQQEHRVLLFTQSRAMIEIFEEFLSQNNYTYLKMDGTTNIGARQALIDRFNNNSENFLFLLTTRVGGLGINLTGANRVIIYDPDWNPATDMQARERAWRIGQKKNVTVYRLISAGTIEEKMYQRQVWKQLLSNKVLTDAKQKRFFKLSDLHELFSLQEPNPNGNIETLNIFQDAKVHESKLDTSVKLFSEEKLKAMKDLAQRLAKKMSSTTTTNTENPETSKKIELISSSEGTSSKDYENEDDNFIWDPTTIRFKKMRKIIIPSETIPKNLVNEMETNIPFNEILEKLETCKPLDVIEFVPTQNESLNVENKMEKKCTKLENENLSENDREKKGKEMIIPSRKNNKQNPKENLNTNKPSGKLDNHLKSVKKKHHHKSDGVVDGEIVQGVVKKERFSKITKNETVNFNEKQDAYVLQQLFSRGVHTALKHDSIVRSEYEGKHTLKDRIEAERKAKSALRALKSTRLRKWRW